MQEETVNEIESLAHTQVEAFPDDLQTTMIPCPNCKEMVPTSLYCLNCGYLFERAQMALQYGVSLICRNEEDNIGDTIESLFNQSIKPVKVIVVDDGSTDETPAVLAELSEKYDNLVWRTVDIPRFGLKGHNISTVIRLSLEGSLELSDAPYLLRMDSDVKLTDPGTVEAMIREMEGDPTLGITGAVSDSFRFMPRHVTDAVRLFRRECFKVITASFPDGRYPIVHGHDSVMIFRARWLGWTIRPTRVYYHDKRPYRRPLKQWFALGLFRHINGYPFIYVLMSTVRYLGDTPYVLGSLTALLTYIIGFMSNMRRYELEYRGFMGEYLTETVLGRIRRVTGRIF